MDAIIFLVGGRCHCLVGVANVIFPPVQITVVENQGKPRGYAFVEYEKERDMHSKCVLQDLLVLITRT